MGARAWARERSGSRRGRAAASTFLVLSLAGGLAACTNDPLAEQYRAGDNKGFIAANGFQIVEIPEAERTEPVDFEGTTETGEKLGSADVAGDVVVVNFWYAACGPCRAEAESLEKANASFEGKDVSFIGINTSDAPETATAFAEQYGVTYPSLMAAQDGAIKLAFADKTPINATPTTLVLDKQGRVAARIIGQLESASILQTLVRDALEES
ncbi:TlpA family protein disulfide reductase [Microbacterium flavescens]|uniref:TlpA family protein disulfide reductase n=1 Tax=Microbacterium flavescens TaxID=69366 RepID=UPI001BDF0454|nr:TlpA disulfide reductase family protein [Microbacterium flavescens]BFF10281.1 TlpA disulfide reductase family protein [Microbacterium flavescens]